MQYNIALSCQNLRKLSILTQLLFCQQIFGLWLCHLNCDKFMISCDAPCFIWSTTLSSCRSAQYIHDVAHAHRVTDIFAVTTHLSLVKIANAKQKFTIVPTTKLQLLTIICKEKSAMIWHNTLNHFNTTLLHNTLCLSNDDQSNNK